MDISARIPILYTYQTMIGHLDEGCKTFSLGRFDLIIIDEKHTAVYSVNMEQSLSISIACSLGLTATHVMKLTALHTTCLFGMEQGEPTPGAATNMTKR